MKQTVCIQIGNTDDKLPQTKWYFFCVDIYNAAHSCGKIHFSGGPPSNTPYQNYCVIAEVEETQLQLLRDTVAHLREKYGQESIAWLSGEVELI